MSAKDSTPSQILRVILRDPEDEVLAVLREAQLLVLKYPDAMQAGFRALVAEGRRFAETPAGQRWKKRLAGSELVRRGRVLWENCAFGMLEERAETVLPSTLLDAIVRALMSEHWPTLVTELAPEADTDETIDPASGQRRIR